MIRTSVFVSLAAVSVLMARETKADDVSSRLVQIETYGDAGWHCAGVGFVLSPNTILTARHVLRTDDGVVPRVRVSDSNKQSLGELSISEGKVRVIPEDDATGSLVAADVALLWSPVSIFPGQTTHPPGWIADAELREIPHAAIAATHNKECMGDADDRSNQFTWLPVEMSFPRVESNEGLDTRRLVLSTAESPAYSGSPVISLTLNRVVAVYTGSNGKRGVATPLSDVLELFSLVPDPSITPERLTQRARNLLVGLHIGSIVGHDSLATVTMPVLGLSLQWLTTPNLEFYWHAYGSLRLVSPGFLFEISSWQRRQVVLQYPGTSEYTANTVHDLAFNILPYAGGRVELWRVALDLVPFAFRIGLIKGPDPTEMSWEPALALSFLLPTTNSRWWATAEGARTVWARARVADYHFDLSGNPGMYDREYEVGQWSLRLAVKVSL